MMAGHKRGLLNGGKEAVAGRAGRRPWLVYISIIVVLGTVMSMVLGMARECSFLSSTGMSSEMTLEFELRNETYQTRRSRIGETDPFAFVEEVASIKPSSEEEAHAKQASGVWEQPDFGLEIRADGPDGFLSNGDQAEDEEVGEDRDESPAASGPAIMTDTVRVYRRSGPSPLARRAKRLHRKWVGAYGLGNETWGRSPGVETRNDTAFPAPHLQNCARVTAQRDTWDRRMDNGSLPDWFSFSGIGMEKLWLTSLDFSTKNSPMPPWIKGGDDENIPLTRMAQALIWAHQHPKDCNDPTLKFAIGSWPGGNSHGIGSQLHLVTEMMLRAIESGRIFVLAPDWPRALHPGCSGYLYGRLDCYFFPVTSAQCEERAYALLRDNVDRRSPEERKGNPKNWPRNDSDVVWAYTPFTRTNVACPPGWPCHEWSKIDDGKEALGEFKSDPRDWWRAQAVRYTVRFPSQYLCHQLNIARHESYGRHVAREVARSQLMQGHIAKHGGGIGTIEKGHLEDHLWAMDEPYIPRPFISMHIRQGGKAKEMVIHPFPAFVEQAERIRRRNPSVKYIWLMSMIQSVMESAEKYNDWQILYTRQKRLEGEEEQGWHDDITTEGDTDPHMSLKRSVDKSLCNLLIAGSADYFVGTLGSNWDRLLDELRKTGGARNKGYVSLNYDQWR